MRPFRPKFLENMTLGSNNLKIFEVRSSSSMDFIDITSNVLDSVSDSGIEDGIVVVYTPHTTAGITINENADPSVRSDMIKFFSELVPRRNYFRHMEGNSPSHIMSSLISPSQTFILSERKLLLGTWQGIFFCEFDGPRTRKVFIKINGDHG